jgi:hypothetical protein
MEAIKNFFFSDWKPVEIIISEHMYEQTYHGIREKIFQDVYLIESSYKLKTCRLNLDNVQSHSYTTDKQYHLALQKLMQCNKRYESDD